MRGAAGVLACVAVVACAPAGAHETAPAHRAVGAALSAVAHPATSQWASRQGVEGRRRVGHGLPPSDSARWVDSVLAGLSLRDKAAQMVWPQILGDYVPEDAPEWRRTMADVTERHVGGFIISVGSPLEIAQKTNALQRSSAVPLLFGADLEAGAGFRARGGYFLPNAIDLGGAVLFPPQMALGATRDSALAYAAGRATAEEGRALGIQVAFAPVLDVNNNPDNPVINTRSLGEDPQLVARLGTAIVRGIQDGGMLATGKHFPGHGDTETNSHLALPIVRVTRQRLDSVELVPFRAAVGAGLAAIMSFHGSMPALDSSGDPATLSPRVLTGLLRREMGFDGLIISDAMDMRGVIDRYGATEATRRAVAAGIDVLIQPVNVAQTIDAVLDGVHRGSYDEARLDASVRRILGAKWRSGVARRRTVDLDAVRRVVGDTAHVALAERVARRSITLVRDTGHLVPLRRRASGTRVLSVTLALRSDLGAGTAFDAELRRVFPHVRAAYIDAAAPEAGFAALAAAADSADVVLVSSYVSQAWNATRLAAPRAFAAFVDGLVTHGRPTIVLAMGNPYLLRQIPSVPTYVVAWGGAPVSQRAAALAVLGVAPITGRLPITIPGAAAFASGTTRSALH